jgi:hypothetical protein
LAVLAKNLMLHCCSLLDIDGAQQPRDLATTSLIGLIGDIIVIAVNRAVVTNVCCHHSHVII